MNDGKTATADFLVAVEQNMQYWEQWWSGHQDSWQLLVQQLNRARSMADDEHLSPIHPAHLDRAIASLKESTATSWDGMTPNFLKHLPKEGRNELAALYSSIEEHKAWPWQLLGVLMRMLAKPAGGTRPIALIIMVVRRWFR